MNTIRWITALACGLLAGSLWAQTATALEDVEMPPRDLADASSISAPPGIDAPGVYYGDTSGRRYGDEDPDAPACEDSTYNEPEVHGDVRAGVSSGRYGGTHTGATVHVTKRLGTCDDPKGEAFMSISVDNFDQRGGGRHRGRHGR